MNKIFISVVLFLTLFSCSKNLYYQKKNYVKFNNAGGHIVIDLKINHYKEGRFYFDTASGWMIIDSSFYRTQHMSFVKLGTDENNVVGNNKSRMIRVFDTIKISANNNDFFSNYNLIHNLRNFIGKDIDGIVGLNNFGKIPFEVNYLTNKIIFNPKIDNSFQEIPVKFDGYFVYLQMELALENGKIINGDFVIDTGSKETCLTNEFADNKDILNIKKVTYEKNALGGLDTGYSLFAPKIRIGNLKLNNKLINISRNNNGALSKNKNYIGIIGNDMLDDFDIIYYPSANKIYVKTSRNFNKPSEDLYKSFILYETDNIEKGWLVGSIYEESDAYKQGLRRQDEIVEINSKSVKKLDVDNFMSKLQPNQKIKLKIKRHNEYFEIYTYLNVFLRKND